jgi:hypothetical protein
MLLSAHEKIFPRSIISPASYTSTVTPAAGIDMKGFDDALIVLHIGTVGGTSPTLNVKMQESADNSTFADIEDDASADLATFVEVTDATGQADTVFVGRIKCSNFRRYLRPLATIAGTSPTVEMSMLIIPVDPKYTDQVSQSETLAFNLSGDERSPIG